MIGKNLSNTSCEGRRFLLLLLAVSILWGFLLTGGFRALNWDELEYARATRWVAEGNVPYRDFFEHHTPLQWYVMAPAVWLTPATGIAAVISLRFAQLPLWFLVVWLLDRCMEAGGLGGRSRLLGVTLLFACPSFVLSAIEYRVDTLGALCLVGALYFIVSRHSRLASMLAGVLAVCAVLANLRMLMIAIMLVLLASLYSPASGRWRWTGRLSWIAAGGMIAAAAALAFAAVTGSSEAAWFHLITANAIGEAALEADPLAIFRTLAEMLGLGRSSSPIDGILNVDLAGLLLLAGCAAGVFLALKELRSGGFIQLVALLQIANLLFIWRMKVVYSYHFEIFFLLSVPLIAFLAERLGTWNPGTRRKALGLVWAVLVGAIAINFGNLVFRNGLARLGYQKSIMAMIESPEVPPGPVWDGTGWAFERVPPYRLWFLPVLGRHLVQAGVVEPYTPAAMIERPPSAIVVDDRILLYLLSFPDLGIHVISHYLPVHQHLWKPGMSYRLGKEGGSRTWVAPASGTYRVSDSKALAEHPWFRNPFLVPTMRGGGKERLRLPWGPSPGGRLTSGLSMRVNGAIADLSEGEVELEKGDVVEVRWAPDEAARGLLIVPVSESALFQPAPDALDLNMPPTWEPLR